MVAVAVVAGDKRGKGTGSGGSLTAAASLHYGCEMGEAKRRSRSRRDILAGGDRCIYCERRADDVEHMPPRVMFKEKLRLSGLEFPSCRPCNKGTSAADLVASFVARLDPDGHVQGWQHGEVKGELHPVSLDSHLSDRKPAW